MMPAPTAKSPLAMASTAAAGDSGTRDKKMRERIRLVDIVRNRGGGEPQIGKGECIEEPRVERLPACRGELLRRVRERLGPLAPAVDHHADHGDALAQRLRGGRGARHRALCGAEPL